MDPDQESAERRPDDRRPSAPSSGGGGGRPSSSRRSSSRRLVADPPSSDEVGHGSSRPSSSRQGSSRFDPRHAPSRPSRGVARDDGYLRKSQRSRRPTNYTEQYTPPSDLLELRRETLAKSNGGGGIKGGNPRLHRKSLDRSEGESEHRAEAHRAAADQQLPEGLHGAGRS